MIPDGVRLVPYTQSGPELELALEVYARVWPERDRAEAREGFTRYAGYDGFRGLIVLLGDEAVGVGYGARTQPGIPWHDWTVPILGADHPALQDAWRLVELAVVPERQGLGIGGALHDALVAAQSCPHLLVVTAMSNTRARGMYARRGWQDVALDVEYAEQPQRYAIMGRGR